MEKSEATFMKEQIKAILEDLNAQEQALLLKILEIEREKLHLKNPRGINKDIWQAVTEIIK